jgi:hypothetical protein
MDTLCVPVDPTKRAFRKKAIQLLGKTFYEASAVLILERELEIVKAAGATFFELAIRILCSGWVKRLWTLQEATLAAEAHGEDKLYFQMSDGPFLYRKYDRNRKAINALDDHTTEYQAEERRLLEEVGVIMLLAEQIPSVHAMRVMREGWSPFRVVYSAIEHRTTSKAEDVPVCIASLLGKDISSILSASDIQHRMAAFYLLMHQIPDGVVWVDRVERLDFSPFQWAPSSIGACPQTTFMGWEDDICDEQGLHVTHSGFRFNQLEARGMQPGKLPTRFRLVSTEGDTIYGAAWPSLSRTTITLEPNMKLALMTRSKAHPSPEPNAAVVLIHESTDVDTEIRGTIMARMFFSDDVHGPDDISIVYCTSVTDNQKWCIM